MEVTVLGYWGGYPWQGEGTSSYLLQSEGYHLLIDAGSSTLNILQQELDPLQLDSVVISHYHHDHIADLGVLQYYRQLHPHPAEQAELAIYGHQEDEASFARLTLPGVSYGEGYDADSVLDIGPFELRFLRTRHPVTCFAMRITEKKSGKVLVYTADTGYIPELADFVAGADVLVADTYFLTGQENHHAHLTSKEAGELAQAGKVPTLVLSHLQQLLDLEQLQVEAQQFAGPDVTVLLAHEKLRLTI